MLEGPLAGPGLVIARHTWAEFCDELVPGINRAGLLVGLNWSGPRARGYNIPPADVIARVDACRNADAPVAAEPEDTPENSTERRAG